MTPREHRIRQRAEQLWREAGQPEGRDEEFWKRAEDEIDSGQAPPDEPGDPKPKTRR